MCVAYKTLEAICCIVSSFLLLHHYTTLNIYITKHAHIKVCHILYTWGYMPQYVTIPESHPLYTTTILYGNSEYLLGQWFFLHFFSSS